jgi:hypothetical protein
MISIISGRVSSFILLLVVCAFIYGLTYASKKKIVSFKIRKLPALDAMAEAIGRATEMGRPVHFTAGYTLLAGSEASMLISAITILGFVSRMAARYKAKLIVSVGSDQALPMQIESVRQAYQAEGRLEDFKLEDIRYLSSTQNAYAAGVIETLVGEQCAANVMVGGFAGEATLLAEAGARAGAIQIGGTPRAVQMPYLAVICDYCLYGEELYAAGAYLSDDLELKGSLAGEDGGKLVGIGLVVLGVLLATLGSRVIPNLLST